jgi:hypothetical protein
VRVLETDNWSLLLPPEWEAEQDEDGVVIADRDGVGCIEISALLAESTQATEAQLKELAGAPETLESLSVGGQKAWGRSFVEDDVAIREWYREAGTLLLYITYSCDVEHLGLDDAAVDDMLSTLSVTPLP